MDISEPIMYSDTHHMQYKVIVTLDITKPIIHLYSLFIFPIQFIFLLLFV